MPEDVTDRRCCHKCNMTVTGKRKLSKCARCHSITYCGLECQKADWPRHSWNCVPVMVTEIPGKGRGLVAARDIKMGELIFIDKPAIILPSDFDQMPMSSMTMESLRTQIRNLPTEAKSQFYKLTAPDRDPRYNAFILLLAKRNEKDYEALKLFMANGLRNRTRNYTTLYLNLSLVNHSCAPNAADVEGDLRPENETEDNVPNFELRAIKDISKGEEINTCYVNNIKRFGNGSKERKAGILEELTFDCACSVCSGQVADQRDIFKRIAELHLQLSPFHPTEMIIGFEKWEARIQDKIVDLTMELYIGKLDDKIEALDVMVRTAHLARDQNLVRKAMDMWTQLAEDTKLADVRKTCQIMGDSLSLWSEELKSRKPPKRREIEFISRGEIEFISSISFYD